MSPSDEDNSPTLQTAEKVRQDQMTNRKEKQLAASAGLPIFIEKMHKEMGDTPEFAAVQRRYDALAESITHQEKEMGLNHTYGFLPRRVDAIVAKAPTSAGITQEGKTYFLLNEKELRAALLSDEKMRFLENYIDHELTHIKNKDCTPTRLAYLKSHPATQREAEMRADLGGSGLLGTQDTQAGIEATQATLRQTLPKAGFGLNLSNAEHPTDEDYKKLSDEYYKSSFGLHPAPWDRITAYRKEEVLMTEAKNDPVHHPMHTHAQRKAESERIINQVMNDMRGKIQDSPEVLRAHDTAGSRQLSPEEMQQLKDIMVGQKAVPVEDPATPHSALSTPIPRYPKPDKPVDRPNR